MRTIQKYALIPQQQQEITLQAFQQNMGALKRRLAQTQGEANQLNSDVMSQTMDSIMNITQQIFSQMAGKDRKITEIQAELDKCYNAHPELKISKEQADKEAKTKAAKAAKKV